MEGMEIKGEGESRNDGIERGCGRKEWIGNERREKENIEVGTKKYRGVVEIKGGGRRRWK